MVLNLISFLDKQMMKIILGAGPYKGYKQFISLARRFWLAVQDLKKRPIREVPARVQEIWQEFLAPGAPSAINVDSKSYDKTTQNVKDPGRYAFEDAQVPLAVKMHLIILMYILSSTEGNVAIDLLSDFITSQILGAHLYF